MLIKPRNPRIFFKQLFKCFLLAGLGLVIILICSAFQHLPLQARGEYFYSYFFRNNYTLAARVIFFISAFLVGYFYRLNPIYAGISLVLVFPVTALVESILYKGSHNLIPFEFVYHLWLALPSVVAIFLGKLLSIRLAKGGKSSASTG